MTPNEFKRIVSRFSDVPQDVILSQGKIIAEIHGDLLEADLESRNNQLFVIENGVEYTPEQWIFIRVAKLPLLADRILSYIPAEPHFVPPEGIIRDQLDIAPADKDETANDALQSSIDILSRSVVGTTKILYLTSDAGEGKTTLINQIARKQAALYKANRAGWLLIPITLGGKPFLRFDDIIVASLANSLRFQYLFYDAFVELVKLGAIIPAFDGFEEMFVENATGEALSALGNVVSSLESQGNILISARKAFFEYNSFETQSKLFDSIGRDSVAFSRISLKRWNKQQFIEYASKNGVQDPQDIYTAIGSKLNDFSHPLLTRAVLVRRLIEVAREKEDRESLLDSLGGSPQDYFMQFVNAILTREVNFKWIDRSGEPHKPLLSIEEHHEILGMLAEEMWVSSSDSLKAEVIEFICEMFSESKKKPVQINRQIKERIKDHALIVQPNKNRSVYSFDHEEFKDYFLGEALGKRILEKNIFEVRSLIRKSNLPTQALETCILHIKRVGTDTESSLNLLIEICKTEGPTSFARENVGALVCGILNRIDANHSEIKNVIIPSNALSHKTLIRANFIDCYFQPQEIEGTKINECKFVDCNFERLELSHSRKTYSATIENCNIQSLIVGDANVFEPARILHTLKEYGFEYVGNTQQEISLEPVIDPEVELTERITRKFLRSTFINEEIIRQKLGHRSNEFESGILPRLLQNGIFEEVLYDGSGNQRRFRLTVPMASINNALKNCKGSFASFIKIASGV